ncbi:PLP-dependent transferase [Thozetella sp. PMI_491]|nr:PLP-dependent transferase [Thozetella sp. PMI_491]
MSPTLTITGVQRLRATHEPIPTSEAPYANSDAFKSPQVFLKPASKRWEHRLSAESKTRRGSTLKGYATSLNKKEVISLGTGTPRAENFPWESIDFYGIAPRRGKETAAATEPSTVMRAKSQGDSFNLGVALNYSHAAGSAQLVRFFTEHTEIVHNPPYSDWECGMTCGTTSALELVFRTFCNRGDFILCEEYTYSGAVEAITPLGVGIQGIKMDKDGLLPEDLDQVLSNWDLSRSPKPFLLYTIPTGHNPTGITQPAERRKRVYEVAEKHDVYIVEDDPYYLLQLGSCGPQTNGTAPSSDHFTQFSQLPPSYLSLDTSGRVLRLDSTSKIIAPGLRCGWMTGSSEIVQKIISHHEVSVVSPSGVSQIMLYKLLDETWGHDGFAAWLENLSGRYRERRDKLLEACEMHLPMSVCSVEAPTAGMFVWVNIAWQKHPSAQNFEGNRAETTTKILEIEQSIFTRAVANGVTVSRGSWFRAERGAPQPGMAFRLTFAAAPEASLVEATKRFGEALKADFQLL